MSRSKIVKLVATTSAPPWRKKGGEEGWHSLPSESRARILSLVAEMGAAPADAAPPAQVEEVVRDIMRAGFVDAKDIARGPGAVFREAEALAWIFAAAGLRLLESAPDIESHVRALFPTFADAQRLAQSAGSRGGFSAGDPYYVLATYSASAEWAEWALPEKKRTPAETKLLEVVRARGGRVPTRDLEQLMPGFTREAIDAARAHLVERLILFHGLSDETLDVEIGVLATEQRRLRGPAVEPLAPVDREPAERFGAPLLERAAVALLLELTREPAKVKRDGDLHVKAEQRLQKALEPLPEWLVALFTNLDALRFDLALAVLTEQGALPAEGDTLAPTEAARELLAKPASERQALLLPGRPSEAKGYLITGDEGFFGVNATSIVAKDRNGRAHAQFQHPTPADRKALREAVARSFAPLEVGRFYDLAQFLERAADGGGPLARGADPALVCATVGHRTIPPVGEALADASRSLLRQVLCARLFVSGGAELAMVGVGHADRLHFALTPFGRYYLGLDAAPPAPSAPAAATSRAIVQPSFEVVLLEATPLAIADLVAFTEPANAHAHGDHARIFKITKASVLAAARAGTSAESLLATLERLSKTGVPDNVARAIRDWAGTIKRVSVGSAPVVQCPDAETLARVASALGKGAKPAPFALVLDKNLTAAQRKKLEKLGIVIDEAVDEEEEDDDVDDEAYEWVPAGPW